MAKSKASSPTLKLEITDEVFERAKQSKSGGCLIADAIKTQYPQYTSVSVDMATVRFSDRKAGLRYTYLTPEAAKLSIVYFDQGWSKFADEVTLRRAVKITPLIRPSSVDKGIEAKRAERKTELEAKVARGEELTPSEKSSLTKVSNPKPPPERPASQGPSEVTITKEGPVVTGGNPLPVQPKGINPNMLRGQDRHFGAKVSKPGVVFEEAVEKALEARLAELDKDGE